MSSTQRERHVRSSTSPIALGPGSSAAPESTTPSAPDVQPASITVTAEPVVRLRRCASLTGTPSATWVTALESSDGGCTLDGKTAANFSALACDRKASLYTTTATGTWYWGVTGNVLHSETSDVSDAFIDAYRICLGFNTTRCLTAGQALALISRDRPGTIELIPPPTTGYRCVDGWAFINYRPVGGGNGASEAIHVEHDEWIEGDRRLGCGDGVHPPTMPVAIRNGGCGG